MLNNLVSLLVEYNDNKQVFISYNEFGNEAVEYANKVKAMLNSAGYSCAIKDDDDDGLWVYNNVE